MALKVSLTSILQLIFEITSKLLDPPHVELQRPPRGMELADKSTYSLKVHCVPNLPSSEAFKEQEATWEHFIRKAAPLSHRE